MISGAIGRHRSDRALRPIDDLPFEPPYVAWAGIEIKAWIATAAATIVTRCAIDLTREPPR